MTETVSKKVFLDSNTGELFIEHDGKKHTVFYIPSTSPDTFKYYITEAIRRLPEEERKKAIREMLDQIDYYLSVHTSTLRTLFLKD
jgi:hypothetical protein